MSQRRQTPSHWRSVHTSGSITVTQNKFITQNNVAVANLSITNSGGSSTTLQLRATSPYATSGSGNELTGQFSSFNSLTTIFPRLSGDGFTVTSGGLNRSVTVGAGQTVTAKLVMGFVTNEIPESLTEYNSYKGFSNDTAFATHVRAYNQWWAQNVPYFDSPELALKKNYYYRWWLMRFNNLDANIPGQTYQFPISMEGVLGYNNAIVLTQPMHMDDLKYLRTPLYAYGDWLSAGQVSKNGRFLDNPGDPANWSNSYTQYIGEAAWRAYQIHGGQPAMLNNLARYAEQDVKGQLVFYDHDGDRVIEYDWGALTGNDADAVSFHWMPGRLDRAEGAYQYSGALAAAQAYAALGNTAKANEMNTLADQHPERDPQPAVEPEPPALRAPARGHQPVRAVEGDQQLLPVRGRTACPNNATYRQALRLFDDPAAVPDLPVLHGQPGGQGGLGHRQQQLLHHQLDRPVQTDLVGAAQLHRPVLDQHRLVQEAALLERLGAVRQRQHPVAGRQRVLGQLERQLHHLPVVDPPQHPGQQQLDAHRGRGRAAPAQRRAGRGLSPINIGWSHFAVNNIRYRNVDLSIIWDDPADGITRYGGVPQGYSIFVNGTRVATVNQLVPFTYNPATGAVTTSGTVAFSTTSEHRRPRPRSRTPTPAWSTRSTRPASRSARPRPTWPQAATVTASFTGSGASTGSAIDGFPTNEPFWGAGGSPNAQDWYEVNFGTARTVNEVRLYFKDSRPASTTYRPPSSYNIQYLSGSTWTTVGNQTKSPAAPVGNYNRVQFTPVSTQRIRVLMTNASGAKSGLTEFKAYNRGGVDPPQPTGNLALSATASCSFTSAWESCAAINNGDEPASSNIPGPNLGTRWGTWPNSGQQWAQLTWSSAVSR